MLLHEVGPKLLGLRPDYRIASINRTELSTICGRLLAFRPCGENTTTSHRVLTLFPTEPNPGQAQPSPMGPEIWVGIQNCVGEESVSEWRAPHRWAAVVLCDEKRRDEKARLTVVPILVSILFWC
ncbi:unnamed protein product [Clonostachys solani]|uniref:Uncharacterized protein n=1 Tax=Clonostachys solani TaxID=160281 RepID=A0A9N9ZGN6_9HYPO|nr:unnamed protein product [Clonostachys solani]